MADRGQLAAHAVALGRNLAAGLRLALFFPVRAEAFRATPADYALLVLLNLGVWLAAAAARLGFEGEFNPGGVGAYLGGVALVLGTALVLAYIYGEAERLVLFAVALAASDAFFELVALGLERIPSPLAMQVSYYGFLAWNWIVAIRAAIVCGGTARPEIYRGIAAVTAATALAFYILPRGEPWLAPEAEEEEAGPTLADERLFHLQGELIERGLAAIQPGEPGVTELYFVGFAPDGSQGVFLNEMRFVKRLFDERFRTAGRSLALASGAPDQVPIASVTNLGRALERVGEAMNPDEDFLFLYLSAHGDRAHRLSAWQPPLELAQLTPTSLARLLQDSGVKWRVIVVSACYSGGFVEPLRDDNTVVITAAAADRTSFGCEAGRDFTYFGEAYFRDALARSRSFIDAFEAARQSIEVRERAEGLTPSLPQIWVGPAIGAKLKELADR
ncbi:MAG: peptidase [Betaproteobacteria bacterium]|nr:peptidase [Betaproteobacteria bacterium]